MEMRKIPQTDISLSVISFGCWTMGGLNYVDGRANGWADVNEDEVEAAIRLAVDRGVNHFDNADVYGNGRAERMLARVLKKSGIKSESVIIASKVGHFPGTAPHAFDPLHIRHQCEQSLKNLQREYIDIYYLHHGDFGPDAQYLHGAAETMRELQKEGKIRVIGQSAYSTEDFERAVPVVKPRVLQSWANAADISFIAKGGRLQDLIKKNQMGFVAFSPLAQGILLGKYGAKNIPSFASGDFRKESQQFSAENLTQMEIKIDKIKSRFGGEIEKLAAVAIQYVLSHENVVCSIPGFRNINQADCNTKLQDFRLSEADIDFIKKVFA